MKKFYYLLFAVALLVSLVVPSMADTIRLKDGSVIRGQVIGFKDQTFTILIGSNSKGRRSQMNLYVEDIESIVFDSASGVTSNQVDDSSANNVPTNAPTNVSQPAPRPTPNTQPDTSTSNPQPTTTTTMAPPTFFTIKVSVRADNANNGWTNSGLVVRKGQRLKITASGRVSLGRSRFSTPAGISSIPDSDKLMRNEATGSLIAVIGDDNDDFILIGPRRDFVAQRDGVLFLGVNEGDLADNTGTYDIVIEAEAGSGVPRP
jgi:hypothetical protein